MEERKTSGPVRHPSFFTSHKKCLKVKEMFVIKPDIFPYE
jgi:hypothetical protein